MEEQNPKESNEKNEYENAKQFKIKKSDGDYDLTIIKEPNKDYIIFSCHKEDDLLLIYETNLKIKELAILNEKFSLCNSIDEIYNLLLKKFENNQVKIRETIKNEIITLVIKSDKIEINLIRTKLNKDYIINKLCKSYNSFIVEIYNLQEENEKLKEQNIIFMNEFPKVIKDVQFLKDENCKLVNEIQGLKSFHNRKENENNEYLTNPNQLQLGHYLTDDSYANNVIDNTFVIFNSRENYIYLVYSTEDKNIQCMNINTKKIIKILLNPHNNNYISNLRYIFDKNNNRDLILSVSKEINHIKIWDNTF